jgi:hypothetical protein
VAKLLIGALDVVKAGSGNALKLGNGYGENQRVEFTLEITVDTKKVDVKISDLVGRASGYDDGARPSKKEEMDSAMKECVDPFLAGLRKELN